MTVYTFCITVPNSIEAEDVNIRTGSGALDIHLHVSNYTPGIKKIVLCN